jgi:hypothetical protein
MARASFSSNEHLTRFFRRCYGAPEMKRKSGFQAVYSPVFVQNGWFAGKTTI